MAFTITTNCTSCGACIQWCPTHAIMGRRKSKVYIEDSRCVSCGACGKVCGHHAIQDGKGRWQEKIRLLAWPKPVWDYGVCNQCGLCLEACPPQCIAILKGPKDDPSLGFPFLTNPKLCLACGFCIEACPLEAVEYRYPSL